MDEIKLWMNNLTQLDLIFRYNEKAYPFPARSIEVAIVQPGHWVSVYDPAHTRVTRNKVEVDSGVFPHTLTEDTAIDCRLRGWELQLSLGARHFG